MYRQHRHSSTNLSHGSSYKHKRVALTPLTPLAVLLEQLSLRVSVVRRSKRDLRYVLEVEHAASQIRWCRARSFDEYKTFQTQLLSALRLGHYCKGECPWLFSFVKTYFPGSFSFFGFGGFSARAVEKKRTALEHVLISLQKFLVDPHNATACSIVAGSLIQLMVEFVLGDTSDLPDELRGVNNNSSILIKARSSMRSSISVTSDEGEELMIESGDGADLCVLCSSRLYDEAFGASTSSSADLHSGSSAHRSKLLSYTTMLSCGHLFHDECIVRKLNEEMRCPVCRVKLDAL